MKRITNFLNVTYTVKYIITYDSAAFILGALFCRMEILYQSIDFFQKTMCKHNVRNIVIFDR